MAASDESALLELERRAGALGVPCSHFNEPDFADSVTAVAMLGDVRALTSSLPLALRPVNEEAWVSVA